MSTDKPWDRPWSMEEIIENSDKWSLAGDVALLNTLKSFADNLISKTTQINNNLHNLTSQLDETSLQLNIAQNEFQSLRNSQFIESRVYEDDETLPQTGNIEKIEDKSEPDRTEDIRQAALKGLEVLDRYFDKIEVSVSDSEDEDIDLPNYVLRPKDLYIDRPLPYVIGSEEWHKSWHVGLEDSSSDSETEKVSDRFSESDSESDLPIIQDRSQIKDISDTSSELDFPQKLEINKPIISSKQDIFHSSDSEDQNSVPVQAPISNKNFAEELAAKLGNVIQGYEEPVINRRPIQQKAQYGDLFFDEPPPLDESKGLFSGGSGLFDDDEVQYSTPVDSKIEESPKVSKTTGPGLFDEESSDDDIFKTKKPVFQSSRPPLFSEEPPALDEKKKPVGGVSVFGGADVFNKKLLKRQPSSDEETKSKKVVIEDKISTKKFDLFADDDELFKTVPKDEKSVSKNENVLSKKINLFDSDEEDGSAKAGLFDDNKPVPQKIIKSEKGNASKLFEEDKNSITKEDKPKEVKNINLFDDDDDLFRGDLFSSTAKSKFSSGLFDDIDTPSDDLFSTEKREDKEKPKKSLFEDLMVRPDDKNSINVDTTVATKNSLLPEEKISAVKPDETDSEKVLRMSSDNVFKNVPESSDLPSKNSESDQIIPVKAEEASKPKPAPRISLFDSPPPDTDDLFSNESLIKTKPAEDVFKDVSATTNFKNIDSQPSDTTVLEDDEFQKKTTATSTSIFDSPFDDEQGDLFGEYSFKKGSEHSKNSSSLFNPTVDLCEDVFTEKKEQPETSNISSMRLFDPVPPPDDEWETKSEPASEENEFFTDQDDVVTQKSSLFSDEPPSLDLPSTSFKNGSKKISEITEKFEKQPPKEEVKQASSSPGKLKHNLNINVSALMPSFLPPKRVELRSPSLERNEDDQTDSKPSFDTTDNVEVLQSITKDRVKVPFHRRPSTRRGRKAALRNSISDFKLDQDEAPNPDATEENTSSPDLLKGSLKSEDLFETRPPKPESSPATKPPKPNLPTELLKSDELFETKPAKPAPKTDLFGDDDDDDIFSEKKVTIQPTKSLKKSLFNDDDTDDDDIFKSSSSETKFKNAEVKVATEKKVSRVSTVKKLENTKVDDDDPLSALLK